MGHLAISEDNASCHILGDEGDPNSIKWVESRYTAIHPIMHRTASYHKIPIVPTSSEVDLALVENIEALWKKMWQNSSALCKIHKEQQCSPSSEIY